MVFRERAAGNAAVAAREAAWRAAQVNSFRTAQSTRFLVPGVENAAAIAARGAARRAAQINSLRTAPSTRLAAGSRERVRPNVSDVVVPERRRRSASATVTSASVEGKGVTLHSV